MNEFDFILQDRISKIQAINDMYDLENNSYISFSGGKDSTIVHYLIDLALPNNNIPRIFINTGVEYISIVKYVKDLAKEYYQCLHLWRTVYDEYIRIGYRLKYYPHLKEGENND